ncbi:hypothetical protein [Rhizobium sp. CNPSo 3490]|uniref:hypothetical protein n=1 Tax=Rhizobium sp. CNPSo 3490 TaxID=3021407 RepID=UPI0025518C15|nr:hypothetical protein [Rhizobium sp. CNPSo 3490]MDK4735220.1 hypothetical protein [Rhizobium sp. CNPSo 3490]
MRAVAASGESCGGAGEQAVVSKGAQQLEMEPKAIAMKRTGAEADSQPAKRISIAFPH